MQSAQAAERWVESQAAALEALPEAESILASQYELGDIMGSDYLEELEDMMRVRLQAIDAARVLLAARLDAALLLEDASLFPPAFPAD